MIVQACLAPEHDRRLLPRQGRDGWRSSPRGSPAAATRGARFVGQSSLADRVDSTPLRALTLSMSALDTASRE
jgi:hypothetical protein